LLFALFCFSCLFFDFTIYVLLLVLDFS